MSVKDRQVLQDNVDRMRREEARDRRALSRQAKPLRNPEIRGFGAFADDDPELHRRFAAGEFDEELIGSFIDD